MYRWKYIKYEKITCNNSCFANILQNIYSGLANLTGNAYSKSMFIWYATSVSFIVVFVKVIKSCCIWNMQDLVCQMCQHLLLNKEYSI